MTTPVEAARSLAVIRWSGATDEEKAAATAAATKTWISRWDDLVDPDRELPEAERGRLATEAKSAHFRELGRRSGEARRARAEQTKGERAA